VPHLVALGAVDVVPTVGRGAAVQPLQFHLHRCGEQLLNVCDQRLRKFLGDGCEWLRHEAMMPDQVPERESRDRQAFGRFTQVTTVLSNNSTWSGLGHALLLLVALWWAWAAYAWLTNAVDPSEGLGTMMVVMAAMFVGALAVPEAFGRHGVVFGTGFSIVAVMQIDALCALRAR
jgi:Bacterial low temperature requirement A protein (LtrA)